MANEHGGEIIKDGDEMTGDGDLGTELGNLIGILGLIESRWIRIVDEIIDGK